MGKEIEIKLAAPDAAALEAVGADARVEAARTGAWQEIRMVTEYLDTPDRAISVSTSPIPRMRDAMRPGWSKNGSIPLFKPAIFLKFMAAYLSLTQAETRARPR